jgi:hypothetical protein
MSIYNHVDALQKIFVKVEDVIAYVTSLPIDEINEVLTEEERRKGKSLKTRKD